MSNSGIHVVTGATGQVGLELCRGLRAAGKTVRAVVLPGDPAIARLHADDVEIAVADVRDLPALRAAFNGADTIYHLAAMVSTSARHDPRLWQVNVEGARNAATAAGDVGARRLLYFSSIVVFDPAPHDQPLDETRPRLRVSEGSPYVRSKVVGEQALPLLRVGERERRDPSSHAVGAQIEDHAARHARDRDGDHADADPDARHLQLEALDGEPQQVAAGVGDLDEVAADADRALGSILAGGHYIYDRQNHHQAAETEDRPRQITIEQHVDDEPGAGQPEHPQRADDDPVERLRTNGVEDRRHDGGH